MVSIESAEIRRCCRDIQLVKPVKGMSHTVLHSSRSDCELQVVAIGESEAPEVTPHLPALVHAPLSVMPTQFPRASFAKARRAATVFNTLIDRVAADDIYLQQTLSRAAENDDFIVSFQALDSRSVLQHFASRQKGLHRRPAFWTSISRRLRLDSPIVVASSSSRSIARITCWMRSPTLCYR